MDETTKRLVGRCIRVSWLQDEAEGQAADVVVKKLLDVQHQDAMTSALSVVEVAVHTEKPGVQTPSLEKDGVKDAPPIEGPGIAMEDEAS